MLLRPDATFLHQATKRAETVFPRGTDWLTFTSQFPAPEVFANSVLDSAIGVSGELGTRLFARADWQNWISTTKISLYEVGTRIGLPDLEGTPLATGLASVYDNIAASASILGRYDDPAELVPELLKNAGLQVIQQLAGQSSMIAQTIAQVLAAAVWAFDVAAGHQENELRKNVPLPPLQSEDPATDSWQVNRVFEVLRSKGMGGIVYPDGGAEPASNADYTSLFLPAYRYNRKWAVQHRETGVAAQQGNPTEARGPHGDAQYNFDPGDGSSFGFMPGTTTTLRVLQASYRFYHTVRGTPVNRYTIRCRGVNKDCRKMVKSFDGSRDCRQCVDPESVWPVQGIAWAYGGSPLNVTTPGENVGAFYPSTNKLLFNLLEQISQPGPLLYTVDTTLIRDQWKQSFEHFWEFAASEWSRYHGSAWRGLISRLATLMTSFELEGEPSLGGRDHRMPSSLIASARDAKFTIPFKRSIYSKIIEPYCRDLRRLQFAYLNTVNVAYIPPGVGGLYTRTGKLRRDELSDRFLAARTALLKSNRRVLVDLRQVSDPEYRAELEAVGVKSSPVNTRLHGSPGIGDGSPLQAPKLKPPRVLPPPPKVAFIPALASAAEFGRLRPTIKTKPPRAQAQIQQPERSHLGLGLGLAGLTITSASIYAFTRKFNDDDE